MLKYLLGSRLKMTHRGEKIELKTCQGMKQPAISSGPVLNDVTCQLFLPMVLGSVLYIPFSWFTTSQSIRLSRLFQEKTGCCFVFLFWEKKGWETCWSGSFCYFRLEECMRKKDREAESHSGGSVKEGGGDGLYSQFKVFRSRHSQQRCLLAWPECCWCYHRRGNGMLVALHVLDFFPHQNYRLFVVIHTS